MKKVMIKKALSEEEEQQKALQANEASFRCFLCPNFVPSVSSTIQVRFCRKETSLLELLFDYIFENSS